MTTTLDAFIIEASKTTPKVHFDPNSNTFEIEGRSLPENALSFYAPVLQWLKKYSDNPNTETVLNFKIDYFNTPSTKQILDIFKLVDLILARGSKTKVNWYHKVDDDDMKEVGREYAGFVKTPIELILF